MKKNEGDNVKDKFSDLLDIPKEILEDLPKIVLTGNKELFIENYKGLIEYSDNEIKINSKNNLIHVIGRNLCIKLITSEEIIISGRISKINFLD